MTDADEPISAPPTAHAAEIVGQITFALVSDGLTKAQIRTVQKAIVAGDFECSRPAADVLELVLDAGLVDHPTWNGQPVKRFEIPPILPEHDIRIV